jgi:hypothetical protein
MDENRTGRKKLDETSQTSKRLADQAQHSTCVMYDGIIRLNFDAIGNLIGCLEASKKQIKICSHP